MRSRRVAVTFPLVGEAVNVVEFDGAVGVDEVSEHATATHSGELAGIPHHHHPPRPVIGEKSEGGEFRGGDGADLVHDHRRPRRQVIPRSWWPVGTGVFVEQLVQRVGGHRGFGSEHFGGRCGGCHPEHHLPATLQIMHGGGKRGGLARPGRTHDQLQRGHPRHRPASVGLPRTQTRRVEAPRSGIDDAGELALPVGPFEDLFLLIKDGPGGEGTINGSFADRASITPQHHTSRDRR